MMHCARLGGRFESTGGRNMIFGLDNEKSQEDRTVEVMTAGQGFGIF